MDTAFLRFDLFFNLLGILLTFMAMAIVGRTTYIVVGKIRNGLLSFFWGLTCMFVAFAWGVAGFYYFLPDAQIPLMVVGMLMILFSAKRLFSIYNPERS